MLATEPSIPTKVLLSAYAQGIFPMAHSDGSLQWHRPDPRAIFDLAALRPDRATARLLRGTTLRFTVNEAFEEVMLRCSEREETWIDERIVKSYVALHDAGHAHSVEAWHDGTLVGGIYGVSLGAAFFGESMFGMNNSGKAVFHWLAAHLGSRGFRLFDTQYINPFTQRLGAFEISRAQFERRLAEAIKLRTTFA